MGNIEDLPDFPALSLLSDALWAKGPRHGAAVLIGAGVSRGALRLDETSPLPPLWGELAAEMARELYSPSDISNVPQDALRLAEEYRVNMGRAALESFIRRHIKDDGWEPSEVHTSLLSLPWTDILTTNYDTLLERTAIKSTRGYAVVRRESDLADSRAPRIIKLHGSLEDGASFIISEEDFRTYPQRHAAFVNVARQIFIENELCLLGFSGDDPNFLSWIGWVRDNLADQARRIYLVGALDLAPVKRRLLESRNIIPIDMSPLIEKITGDPHKLAADLFLSFLIEQKPPEQASWEPVTASNFQPKTVTDSDFYKDTDKALKALNEAVILWKKDRESYPGWIVCPYRFREYITDAMPMGFNLPKTLDLMEDDARRNALLELAWRYDCAGDVASSWLFDKLDTLATEKIMSGIPSELCRAVVQLLLDTARRTGDVDRFDACVDRFQAFHFMEDVTAIVAYARCLAARDRLDFSFVEQTLQEVSGYDPIWGFRRATLQFWIGNADNARQSIREAAREIRRRCGLDAKSTPLRSRYVFALLLAKALRWEDQGGLLEELEGYDRFEIQTYDPFEEIRFLEEKVGKKIRERRERQIIEPLFEPGAYRDPANTVHFTSESLAHIYTQFLHVSERAGLPVSTRHANVLQSRLVDALDLFAEPSVSWLSTMLATLPGYDKNPVVTHFSRIAIARLDTLVVDALLPRIETALAFWRSQVERSSGKSVETLRLFIEILARLTVRDDPETAKKHVRLAVELALDQTLNHFWLYRPIGHLLQRSFEAVPPDQRYELSEDMLRFPLFVEKGNGPESEWPDPAAYAYSFIRRTPENASISARVRIFLDQVEATGSGRTEAAMRLFYLHRANHLTPEEADRFASALWRDVSDDAGALPEDLNLHPHAFLLAPQPDELDVRQRVYDNLYARNGHSPPDALIAAVTGHTPTIPPSEEDAVRLFDNAVKWRPEPVDSDSLTEALQHGVRERTNQTMAAILGIVAAPFMNEEDRTVERGKAAIKLIVDTELLEALPSLAMFFDIEAKLDQEIISAFKTRLMSRDDKVLSSTIQALSWWVHWHKDKRVEKLPHTLAAHALTALERYGEASLASLVRFATKLLHEGFFSDELDRLAVVLEELEVITNYNEIDLKDHLAISASLIRKESVQLAEGLKEKGCDADIINKWIEEAHRDPLPEVRYASSDV